MTNQDLENIRAVAPKWAGWFCVVDWGSGWWQPTRGKGKNWDTLAVYLAEPIAGGTVFPFLETVADGYTYAIDLKTGAIHVQHAGKIVVVTLAEWSAEE